MHFEKPQFSTGNLEKPRDLQFRGPFEEMFLNRACDVENLPIDEAHGKSTAT